MSQSSSEIMSQSSSEIVPDATASLETVTLGELETLLHDIPDHYCKVFSVKEMLYIVKELLHGDSTIVKLRSLKKHLNAISGTKHKALYDRLCFLHNLAFDQCVQHVFNAFVEENTADLQRLITRQAQEQQELHDGHVSGESELEHQLYELECASLASRHKYELETLHKIHALGCQATHVTLPERNKHVLEYQDIINEAYVTTQNNARKHLGEQHSLRLHYAQPKSSQEMYELQEKCQIEYNTLVDFQKSQDIKNYMPRPPLVPIQRQTHFGMLTPEELRRWNENYPLTYIYVKLH